MGLQHWHTLLTLYLMMCEPTEEWQQQLADGEQRRRAVSMKHEMIRAHSLEQS